MTSLGARALRAAWFLGLLGAVTLVGGARVASAQNLQQQWRAKAQAYCQQFGLPMKEVPLAARPGLCRIVVPVLANTYQAFEQAFNVTNGAMIYRAAQDKIHVTVNIAPGDYAHYGYGAGGNGYAAGRTRAANPNMAPNGTGQYQVFGLPQQELQHLLNFWAADGASWNTYVARHPNQQQRAGCMWWLVQAEVGPNQSLWHRLGVSRSASPANLLPKVIHAGNEWVGPLGIAVNSIEQFNAMTADQLLGPPPGGGAADAAR
ncbi:MAG: hypothetical protein IT371_23195 [Deltaproteobacteria bacterium]|nr:hypothetical protein [Deltaproteobacteria bacterium]